LAKDLGSLLKKISSTSDREKDSKKKSGKSKQLSNLDVLKLLMS
jgi:hypothetical protein